MKKNLLSLIFVFSTILGFSQTQELSIHDVQFVSIADLAACKDLSTYDGVTVKVRGVALHDGSLTEVASGSVTGGCRPGIHLIDTADAAVGGNFSGVQIHGVEFANQGNPITKLHDIVAGDTVEIIGAVGNYQGETQIYPLDNSSVTILNSGDAPEPIKVSIADLNDENKVNQLSTGEKLEGSLVMLNNVTVTAVSLFSSDSRVSFDVTDANGNTINVSDRFLAQKLPSYTPVNPLSPQQNGSFVAPPVGVVYDTLIGLVLHSENGCTKGTGRGYELDPFDASHYVVGITPPSIIDVVRDPATPKSTDSPKLTCRISDFDGSVVSADLYYTNDIASGVFQTVPLTLVGGSSEDYEATIPAYADGDMVGYYIKSVDDEGNVSQYPTTPTGSASNNVEVYTVRDNGLQIVDVQKVLDYNNDESYYVGQTVTVTGVVSASAKDYDLGYVYIQQTGATEWAGLSLYGNSDLVLLSRTEEVTVTGVIEEYYNFTRMSVTSVTKTGNIVPVETTFIDPSNEALYTSGEIEKYEGMTLGYANPNGGLFMTNENVGYGDYSVGTSATATQSSLVTAGRQTSSAFTSLWVSLVSDGYYWDNDGQMEVDTVVTTPTMEMDSISGILYYGYSAYKLMPRNNDDIVNLSDEGLAVVLDPTQLAGPTQPNSVAEVNGKSIKTIVYPNPASDVLAVSVNGLDNFVVAIYDLSGRKVSSTVVANNFTQVAVNTLRNGIYLVKVSDRLGNQLAIDKIAIKH